jgi:hypothetical protein
MTMRAWARRAKSERKRQRRARTHAPLVAQVAIGDGDSIMFASPCSRCGHLSVWMADGDVCSGCWRLAFERGATP